VDERDRFTKGPEVLKVTRKAPGWALFTIIALAVGCLMAGCGSASSSTSSSGSAAAATSSTTTTAASSGAGGFSARRTQLVACLKQHGVTLPARPAGAPSGGGGAGGGTGTTGAGGPPGGGFFGGGGGGGGARRFANNPKMQAAFKACGADFGFRRGNFAGRISHTTITKYVDCVRQHGYDLPNPNFSGKGSVFPSNIRTNPKFVSASKACQSILIPARPPGGGTSTNSGA
jgi:uncharacterized protein YceK